MNKRVFLYLDNQLTGKDLAKFNSDLQNDPELRKQLEESKALFQKAEMTNIKPDLSDYFAKSRAGLRVSAERHNELRKARSIKTQKLAYAGSLVTLILVALVLLKTPPNRDYFIQEISTLPADDKIELMNKNLLTVEARLLDTDQFPETEAVSAALSEEIGLSQENAPMVLDDLNISTDDLMAAVTQEEMDQIFMNNNHSVND